MDRAAFFRARSAALADSDSTLIGTLAEKKLHAILKWYLEEDPAYHEIKVGGFFADVCVNGKIFEIQTRAFHRLVRKLDAFLPSHEVTVVYPIARNRRLTFIDTETGEFSEKKMSPKHGKPSDAVKELYAIRKYLTHPHFRLRLITLDCDDYKRRSRGRRREKVERIPYDIIEDVTFSSPSAYAALLPNGLPETFTSADVAKLLRIPRASAGTLLLLLTDLSQVDRVGREGSAYLYQKSGACRSM